MLNPLAGPAAIAQSLDGTHLPDRVSGHLPQHINPNTSNSSAVMVGGESLEDVAVISSMETTLSATLSPSSAIAISHSSLNGTNANELSVNAIVPQVTLPDQILQLQSDEPSVMSPTSGAGVMMVSENSMSVTTTLSSQILRSHSYESTTLSPSPTSNCGIPNSMTVSSSLNSTVSVTSGLEHPEDIMGASDVLLHIGDLSIPAMNASSASVTSQHANVPTVVAEKQNCSSGT